MQAESAMEQAFECLDIQETSLRDLSKQISTELDCELVATAIQQKQKTFNVRYKEARSPASSMLQLDTYFRPLFRDWWYESLTTYRLSECPEPHLRVLDPLCNKDTDQEMMNWD